MPNTELPEEIKQQLIDVAVNFKNKHPEISIPEVIEFMKEVVKIYSDWLMGE